MKEFIHEVVVRIIEASKNPNLTQDEIESLNYDDYQSEVIESLMKIFIDYSDEYIKSRAMDGIMHFKGFDREEFLIKEFESADERWQGAIIGRLGSMSTLKAIGALITIAKFDSDADNRYLAVKQLANHGTPSNLEDLQWIYNNDDGEDYEGFKVSDAARITMNKILSRHPNESLFRE
ncbi:HEAT repeat domain-containing protein [Deinococcus indicus]|uniref:HEAT repeat domain-containing protein n=1 Tax=Deinococcus indicus TaxID=223556 RepID=UPI0011775B4C|nr:HEAT repeat domain-containing protein [Deinococcus indicus]